MITKKTFGKRVLSLLLTLLMVLSLVPMSLVPASAAEVETVAVGATAAPYDGVPVTPTKITSSNYKNFGLTDSNWSSFNGYYGIRDAKELYGFANLVNGGNRFVNAVLLQNIVVNKTVSASGATYEWVPIGASSGTSFMGTFDGNGCTISGLYCNYATASGVGLFGTIGTAIQTNSVNIKNLVLANSYISGSNGLGGIVGCAIGYGATISNCVVSEDVMIVKSIDNATPYTGGIIGKYGGLSSAVTQKYKVCCTVSNCVNLGTVQILIYDFKGGVNNRYNIGSITGAYATEDNAYEFIDVNNCYYLSGHLKDKNGNSLKADGTVVDIGKGGEINRMSDRDCTILSSASASHSCLSVTHKEVQPTCQYTGLSEYSFCLICGKVTSGAKNEYETTSHNWDYYGFCTVCDSFQPANCNSEGIYELSNAGQLYWFADFVNTGNVNADAILLKSFSQTNYTQTVGNVIIGTAENNYKGTFDGNGNRISVELTGEESIALFGYLNGATIKNLEVYGENYVTGKYGAGIASHTYGNTVFEKCTSYVNIESGVIGDGTHGGFVGVAESGTLTINNCVFNGGISGYYTDSCGGFVGWSNATTKISNSYHSATFTTDEANCYTFGRNPSKYTITNCYYLDEYGTANSGSVQKTVNQFKSGEVVYLLQDEQTEHIWGQNIGYDYYPVIGGEEVNFGYECGATVKTYTNNQVFAEVTEHKYENGSCTVCGAYEPATDENGDGVYEISNADQLYWFAQQVLNGNNKINGILTNDITVNENVLNADGTLNGDGSNFRVWIPIGENSSVSRFGGSFDGNGHVIKGLYHSSNKSYIGLFGCTIDATIQNVGIEDSYFYGNNNVGGVIGGASNYTVIKNCYNTGTVKNTGYYIGGVTGYSYSGEITNCYNAGVVNGKSNVGAVVGFINNPTIENCYYLAGCATDSTGAIKEGVGFRPASDGITGDVTGQIESKTSEQFASGEVAYLLNESTNAGVFHQNLDNGNKVDAFPVFDNSHGAVYYGYNCYVSEPIYTNSKVNETPGHKFSVPTCVDAATCTYCGLTNGLDPENHITTDTYYKLKDDETHNLLHRCCDAVISTEEHTPGNEATCTEQKYCIVCLSTYGETNGENHTGELAWDTTDYNHIKKWTCCGATEGVTETHTPDFKVSEDGSTLSATCSVCETDLGSVSISFEDGVVYDGKEHSATKNGYIYCAYGDKTLRFTYWQNGERVDDRYDGGITKAGTYTVRLGTYDQTAYIEKDVTIQKRELTVDAIYVNNKVYDGNNKMTAYSASFNNVAEGEVLYAGVEGTLVVSDSKAGCYETVKGVESISVFASTIASYYGDNYYVTVDPEKEYPVADGGCYINQRTLTVTAENQSITEGEAIDQSKYTLENLLEDYECSGITLETNDYDNVISVNTDNAVVTYNGEDVTENFSFNTYSGIRETVCQGHQFDEDGFCATGECGVYQTPEYIFDEYGSKTYIITNAGELYFYAQQVNVYWQNSDSAKLANDIKIPLTVSQGGSIPDWTPINDLYAEFDGQGHTVSGLYCKSDASYIGMFGYTGYYPIKNLIISDSYFEGTGSVGAVAGYSQAEISNCGVTDTVTVVGDSYSVGGFVGYNISAIRNSFAMNSSFVVYSSEYYGASTENCYYLADEETDSYGGTTAKSAEAFSSGEVAYLLQSGIKGEDIYDDDWNVIGTTTPEEIWGQKIGTDAYPVLGGDKVYTVMNCKDEVAGYSNTEGEFYDHNFVNGFCTVCDGFEPATDENEDGVYEIANAGQLYWFAEYVNAGNTSANAILTADIVVNEGVIDRSSTNVRVWTPIGNSSQKYTGIFDGGGFTVSGMYLYDANSGYVGLFGYVGTGTVKNVGVVNSFFCAYISVGGVVGENNGGIVSNCYSSISASAKNSTGGIVGYNAGTVKNCHSNVSLTGENEVGGVVGSNKGTVMNCYSIGSASGSRYSGSIVGYMYSDATVTNCYYLVDEETEDGGKTAEQFASGEVAYLLQGEQTEDVWGQKIGTDAYPVLGGDKVYTVKNCKDEVAGYSNTEGETIDHNFVNGFCTLCGGFEPATDDNEDGVYEISNAGQLYWFADKVNNDNANFGSANAILTEDIVVNEGVISAESVDARAWTPIGKRTCQYTGTFDGNGKTISGLYYSSSGRGYVGLFGFVGANGAVENTGVINSYFNGYDYIGGVVGYNDNGTITNCYNTSEIVGTNLIGGVIGVNFGTIENCYNTGNISGSNIWVGGVAGSSDGTITNCGNTGDVSGYGYVGGVIGFNEGGAITNCYNTGDVSGYGSVGGVVGSNVDTIANCYNTGSVSGSVEVGGVVGTPHNKAVIMNCYYLDTANNGGIGIEGASDAVDVECSAESKTSEQFKSGEVAYLLQGEQEADVWGQKIGTDVYPTLGGDKVYAITDSDGNITGYTNTVQTDKLAGYTISLGDKIAVNYYMSLTEKTLNDANAKMVFAVPDTGSTYTVEIPVSEAVKSGDYYVFTCKVAAKEMTSAISAKLVTSESELVLDDYTVQEYAEVILSDTVKYAKEQKLVKAMLNYGAQAQIYFNYNTDNLANDTELMTEEEKTVELYGFAGAPFTLEGEESGVTYYGTALSLETELAFKHYFIIEESVDAQSLEITCDYPATLKKNGNFYELIISDIPAHKMGENSLKVALGGITLDYTIYSYGALAQNSGKEELWTVVSALAHFAGEATMYAYK